MIRSNKGMSLSETLFAVLLMSFVTLTIAAGVTAGARVYRKITMRAEEQALLSTSVAQISDYLEKADGTIDASGESITLQYSEAIENGISIFNDSGNKGIRVSYTGQTDDNHPLISDKANTSGLYAKISDCSYDMSSKVFRFKVTVYHENEETSLNETVQVRRVVQNPDLSTASSETNTETEK